MKIYSVVETNCERRIGDVTEIIAELRDPLKCEPSAVEPMEVQMQTDAPDQSESANVSSKDKKSYEDQQRKKKVEAAKIKVKLNILQQELEDAIQSKNFMEAQEIKLKMDELDVEQNKLTEALAEPVSIPETPPRNEVKESTQAQVR